uniref:Inhibitor of growth protein n=1 Tax=Aceria tosichella TaxID=561515 RepID=A0A6G1SF99_9ACAR
MSITSFDHFIETLEPVPPELQRNFTAIAELDQKTREFLKRVDECVKEYMITTKTTDRLSLYKESIDLLEKARLSTDDKVELATQTYDLIDKHIRRLESLSGAQNINQQGSDETETSSTKSGQRKGAHKGNESPESRTVTPKPFTVDMPPDPNEPRYCTCQQVSFGEMIACDNKDCPIEWFHFPCVDLKSKPKGKWYCPECYNANKKWKQRY